jgi:hypothetical protein
MKFYIYPRFTNERFVIKWKTQKFKLAKFFDSKEPKGYIFTCVRRRQCALGRCYDFKNIFAEKFSKKIGVFDSKQS